MEANDHRQPELNYIFANLFENEPDEKKNARRDWLKSWVQD
jgi:hypothetical protein